MEHRITKHLEEVLFCQFEGSDMLLRAGFQAGECLPYCVRKKMQEFCNNYKGCRCLDCRENYICYNRDVERELMKSCIIPFMDYYEFKYYI